MPGSSPVRSAAAFALGAAADLLACSAPQDGQGEDSANLERERAANPLPREWPNNGSSDCRDHQNSEPTIYTFTYDADTFILRENKCLNYEANFIYVFFGTDKVLLQDTGSIPRDFVGAPGQERFRQLFPLRDTVENLIGQWLRAHPNADGSVRPRSSIELLVTHSHSHGDHVSGDFLFKDPNGQPFPYTRIAGLKPRDVATFFGMTSWPDKAAVVDLGGRRLEVLPIPGHEPSHVAVYDPRGQLLLTGDTLYPGHLFVNDWADYRASVKRLNDWVHEKDASGGLMRPITFVLGNHIEKKPAAGEFYPYPSWIQDPERKLELLGSHLELLMQQTQALGASPPSSEIFFDDFSIDAQ
jgi:hydroxyacylglutathione hydrolase